MAKSPGAGQGLFASSARALRRLQAQFEALKNGGHDPTIVQFTARRPVPDYTVIFGRAGYELFDLSRDSQNRRLSYQEIEARRHVASWQVEDGHENRPGADRWFFLYMDDATLQQLKEISADASRLVYNAIAAADDEDGISYQMVWPNIPRGNHGLYFAYWLDLVFEVGRWTLESAPIAYSIFPLDDRYRRDGTWEYNYRSSEIWTNPRQPPGWEQRIDRFLSASVYALDLLIEWGETGTCPWVDRLHRIGIFPVQGFHEWQAPIDWLRHEFLSGVTGISESKFARRFYAIGGVYNLVRWLESVKVLGPKRHGHIMDSKNHFNGTLLAVDDYRELLPGVVDIRPPDENKTQGAIEVPTADSPATGSKKLPTSVMKAGQQYLRIKSEFGDVTDSEAYQKLSDGLEEGESLPNEETWTRYLRSFRKAQGLQKNSPRKARDGRSVIQANGTMKPD